MVSMKELQEKMKETIDGIQQQDNIVREEIRQKMVDEIIKAGRAEGMIVDDPSQLRCLVHQGNHFKERDFNFFKMYVCQECLREARERGDIWLLFKFEAIEKRSMAYKCRRCHAIIYGNVEEVLYTSDEASWHALAGREGKHYLCRICGELLGYNYWAFS